VPRRAAHLLELCGEPLDEEADTSLLGADFLMHIMEVREEIDSAPGDARLQEMQQQNAAEAAEVCEELGAAFASNQLAEAQALTARLQYLHRVQATITDAL
jgi:DnaJ-domain-containing protein 1